MIREGSNTQNLPHGQQGIASCCQFLLLPPRQHLNSFCWEIVQRETGTSYGEEGSVGGVGGGGEDRRWRDSEEPQERLLKESRERYIYITDYWCHVTIVSTIPSKDKFVSCENTVFCILAESN